MRAADWRAFVLALFIVPTLACDASESMGPVVPSTPVTPPAPVVTSTVRTTPFYQGVYLGDANTTPERVAAALDEFGAQVGRTPTLVKSFHDLDADFSSTGWAGRLLRAIDGTSATNYLALDLNWSGRQGSSLLDAINSGSADAAIARAARGIAALHSTVLIELAWEMNGNWSYAWQGASNGSNASAPLRYATAWRHVVDVFRAQGATNVRWVFNPNTGNSMAAGSPGSASWNWWRNYYPGDAWVDYVGAHGYNAPRTFGTPYHDYNDLFFGADSDHMLTDMMSAMPNKPILLGEIGAEQSAQKAEWIRDAYTRMLGDSRIAGAVWFNMNKEADWRVDSDAASLAAYRSAVTQSSVVAAAF